MNFKILYPRPIVMMGQHNKSLSRVYSERARAEWFATGFHPEKNASNCSFKVAIQQTTPVFEVERLDGGVDSGLNGIDSMMSSMLIKCGPSEKKRVTKELICNWKLILGEGLSDYHVVGVRMNLKEANVWVYHSDSHILFTLGFALKDGDDWRERPIYHFT